MLYVREFSFENYIMFTQIDIFVVALSEVLYMSHFLYLHLPPFCAIVHSHKNLLECLSEASP